MNDNLHRTLEFDKVLEDLARRTHCPLSAKRLLDLRPLLGLESVKMSLGRISEVRTLMDSGESVPMSTFEDTGGHLESAAVEGSYLGPEALRQIHTAVELSSQIHGFLRQNRATLPLVNEACAGLSPNPGLAKEIVKAIDLGSLEIRDQASPALAAIRRGMARSRERVRRQLEGLLDSLSKKGVLQERLITMRSGRWVLPVRETHRHLLKGVLHDKSASGATIFVEPLVTLEPNNQIRRLEAEERHEIEKVLRTLTGHVRNCLPELAENFEILITLDCIHAAALASKALNQHEPAVTADGVLKIKGGRHPLLALQKRPRPEVVPLDLCVGANFDTLVITGPNAGGKTVALKTVGLLTLMAWCGLHIPADADTRIPLFNRIFASVGDAQSIEMNLSTFSAHLKEIRVIAEQASSGDLVLIDEIGTGTDPQEGTALAMAVLEALTARGVLTLVTTHHGALKAFAHQTPRIANGSMTFDSHALTPTYRFRADLPGSSYALEIARRMGLPEDIISRSRVLMGSQANQVEELILKLNDQIDQNTRLGKDLVRQNRVVKDLRKQYEEQQSLLARESRRVRHEAAQEAAVITRRANVSVEEAIRTIREKGASKTAIREARTIMKEEKRAVENELGATAPEDKARHKDLWAPEIKSGHRVCWRRTSTNGIVLSDADSAGRLLVGFGDVKARVPKEELTRTKEDFRAVTSGPLTGVEFAAPEKVQTETDIRGKRVEEALSAVDKFLDNAMLASLGEVRIIHGVGTGALRSNLIPFLDQHPLVQTAHPGGTHKENMGVTIVKMVGGR